MKGESELSLPLARRPAIAQAGLCLHGSRPEETFRMRGLWALHAYRYRGEIVFGERTYPFKKGCVSITPPDTEVRWRFPTHAPHYYAHFSVEDTAGTPDPVPVVTDAGRVFERFCEQFEELIEMARMDAVRASVRLWDMLLDVARGWPRTGMGPAHPHPAVQVAMSRIRNGLHEPLRVAELAREIGVSQTHLTSLFRKTTGCTVHEFLHRRRVERALHLLRHSSLSIKSVAIESGFPDLHHFNKVVRTATGRSPREMRAASGAPAGPR